MAFDPKCYDLARYFNPDAEKDFLSNLAEEIQQTVEDARPTSSEPGGLIDEDDRTMWETGYC